MSSQNPFQNVKAGVETVAADVAKVAPTVKADIAKAESAVVAANGSLTLFIKNNAGKISIGVLVAAGLLAWHLI